MSVSLPQISEMILKLKTELKINDEQMKEAIEAFNEANPSSSSVESRYDQSVFGRYVAISRSIRLGRAIVLKNKQDELEKEKPKP